MMMVVMVMAEHEMRLDSQVYGMLRLHANAAVAPPMPSGPRSLLIRETEGDVPTGRWTVLEVDLLINPPCWSWPPAASNDGVNAASAKLP